MGENTFDIYAVTNETDKGVELSVAYDLGEHSCLQANTLINQRS